jgi:hypothetical protein
MSSMLSNPASSQAVSNAVALEMLHRTYLSFDAPVLDLGAGSSSFLPVLLAEGFNNVLAVEISASALEAQAQQLPPEKRDRVLWVVDDVTHAEHLPALDPVYLWHDRVMLPVLNRPEHLKAYQDLLEKMVKPREGWVLLNVPRPGDQAHYGNMLLTCYGLQDLQAFMGTSFVLRHSYDFEQVEADGTTRPCLYALFQRTPDVGRHFRK